MTTVTVPRPGAIAAVLTKSSRWAHGTRKADGREFWIIPGTQPGVTYYSDATDCTCPDARERQRVCKHPLAVARYQDRRAKRIGLASPAESDLAFADAAPRLRGPQAGAAVLVMPYGPCISKQGCDQPANGKSRLCGRYLDALLDQLGA